MGEPRIKVAPKLRKHTNKNNLKKSIGENRLRREIG